MAKICLNQSALNLFVRMTFVDLHSMGRQQVEGPMCVHAETLNCTKHVYKLLKFEKCCAFANEVRHVTLYILKRTFYGRCVLSCLSKSHFCCPKISKSEKGVQCKSCNRLEKEIEFCFFFLTTRWRLFFRTHLSTKRFLIFDSSDEFVNFFSSLRNKLTTRPKIQPSHEHQMTWDIIQIFRV